VAKSLARKARRNGGHCEADEPPAITEVVP